LWDIFRNKFQQVADDTPTTHPPDGYVNAPVNLVPPAAPAIEEASVPASAVKELTDLNTDLTQKVMFLETKVADAKVLLNVQTTKCENLEKALATAEASIVDLSKKVNKKKG
jgi:hypothetical protein